MLIALYSRAAFTQRRLHATFAHEAEVIKFCLYKPREQFVQGFPFSQAPEWRLGFINGSFI